MDDLLKLLFTYVEIGQHYLQIHLCDALIALRSLKAGTH